MSLMSNAEDRLGLIHCPLERLKRAPIFFMKQFFITTYFVIFCLATMARGQTSTSLAEVRIRGDVRRIQPMADGSFVLGGYTAYFNGVPDGQLLRVFPDGTRAAFPVSVSGPVQAMAVSGTWLYLGGDFQVVNGVSCPFVARWIRSGGPRPMETSSTSCRWQVVSCWPVLFPG